MLFFLFTRVYYSFSNCQLAMFLFSIFQVLNAISTIEQLNLKGHKKRDRLLVLKVELNVQIVAK